MEARTIIKKEYGNSQNFMTPHVIRYGKMSKNVAYELSDGEGFDHKPIYGVSIVILDESTNRTERSDDSDVFGSLEAAETFIKEYTEKLD